MKCRIGILAPSILVMTTTLFLAGCTTVSTSTTVPGKSAGPTDTVDSTEASGEDLTLSDFVPGAVAFGDEADAEQQYRQQEREAQDKIAACMAAEGFEYVPYVPNQDQGGFAKPDTQEEYVAQYGFGIATMMLEDRRMDEADYIEAEMAKDPNNAIVEAMSDSEQEAYYEALYGGRNRPTDHPGRRSLQSSRVGARASPMTKCLTQKLRRSSTNSSAR